MNDKISFESETLFVLVKPTVLYGYYYKFICFIYSDRARC